MEIKATLLPGQNGTKQLRLVELRIGYGETGLREQVKAAGGRWDPEKKTLGTALRRGGQAAAVGADCGGVRGVSSFYM